MFDFFGDVVLPAHRRGPFTGAIGKDKGEGVADLGEDVVGLLEFNFGLCGEADDDVGAEGDIGDDFAQEGHFLKILLFGVNAVHLLEDAGGAGLDGEVDKFTEGGEVPDRLHEFDGDVDGVGGHKADPFHAWNPVEFIEEVVKKAVPFRLVFAVAIDVLT